MKAVILVGGKGTRLRPLTYDTPKQMLPILGVPMIEWVVQHLAICGVEEVVLSLGHLPERFVETYSSGFVAGIPTKYVIEPQPLDTAGAIKFAARESKIEETFVVLNGDVISDLPIENLVEFHRQRNGLATIATHPVPDPSAFGVVATEKDGRVHAFIEKPPVGSAPSNSINAGVYVLEPEALDYIHGNQPVSVERVFFPYLAEKRELFAFDDRSYWLDTGTLANYLRANLDIVSGKRLSIFEHQLSGNSWCSPQSDVDVRSNISQSVIDNGCRIERSATVEGSVLMPGAVVGTGAVVRDSVIGSNAVVEAHEVVVGSIVASRGHDRSIVATAQ